jgi:hypothetical protein
VSILSKIRDALDPPDRGEPAIELVDSGFAVDDRVVYWSEVSEIRGYKLDLVTVDEIRLVLTTKSGDSIEVSEDQAGFEVFAEAMVLAFPSTGDWHARLSIPAFAADDQVLYAGV